MDTRGTFYWKRETLQRLAGLSDKANDCGRAWVIEADGTRREINNGEVITRTEAERLATVGEYTLDAEQ